MRSRIALFGFEIDALTMAEAIAAFGKLISRRRPSLAFNVNVDICVKILRDGELCSIFRAADLVLADGTPMIWAAQFLGCPLPGRVSGSDFLPAFCRVAARESYRVFLLGGGPGIGEQAKLRLESMNPGLRIAGTYSPPYGFDQDEDENTRIVERVHQSAPDVLFAAFGAPKQEKWLFRFRDILGVPVSMGVGSSLDYLAGRLKRAPFWMQHCGLEWTYRLAQEPRRLWRRYLVDDASFVYYLLREKFQMRATGRS